MRSINRYPVWPDGTRKKQSGFGPLSGTLIEQYDARACLDPAILIGGAIWGIPTLFWKDGDGPTPTISPDPAINLAAVGAGLASGSPTQYQYPSGVDATAEESTDGVSYRRDAVRTLVSGDNDDIIVAVKYRYPWQGVGGDAPTFCGIGSLVHNVGTGWRVTLNNAVIHFVMRVGVTQIAVNATNNNQRSRGIAICAVNRDGNSTIFSNGVQGTVLATPAGSLNVANISMYSNGPATLAYRMYAHAQIEWWAVWQGAGLWETWTADGNRLIKRLSYESLGLREVLTNNKYWSFTTAHGANTGLSSFVDHNGRWNICGNDVPRAGGPRGMAIASDQVNRITTPTVDPTVAPAAITITGGVKGIIDDSAALLAAKAEIWGHRVHTFANATGVVQTAHMGGAGPGNPNRQNSIAVLARYFAGAGAQLGWWETGAGAFTPVAAIPDNYVLLLVNNTTPPTSNTSKYAIQIPDGCTLYYVAMHRIYLPTSGFPTPVITSVTDAFREEATTEHTPVALSGSYLVNLAPVDWSGIEPGSDTAILPCVATPGDILHAESVAAGWATGDGTTQIQTVAPYVPSVGVYVDVWSAWRGVLQYLQQGLTTPLSLATGAYDGNKGMAGPMTVQASRGSLFVKYLQIRQV